MSNQVVLVPLTEAEAERLAGHMAPKAETNGPDQGIYDKVNRAIAVDPETRIEHIARAIAGAERCWCFLAVDKGTDTFQDRVAVTSYRRIAQAVWSALCENPGQERPPERQRAIDEAHEVCGPDGPLMLRKRVDWTPVDGRSRAGGHDEPGVETGSGTDESL